MVEVSRQNRKLHLKGNVLVMLPDITADLHGFLETYNASLSLRSTCLVREDLLPNSLSEMLKNFYLII